jgi:hypothetical protein
MIKVKEDEMDSTCSTHGERRNVYRILVGNIKGKRPFGIPRLRWEVVWRTLLYTITKVGNVFRR